jgi:hypothetical protein
MCCIDGQENKYSVLNECSRMLKCDILCSTGSGNNYVRSKHCVVLGGLESDHSCISYCKVSHQIRLSCFLFLKKSCNSDSTDTSIQIVTEKLPCYTCIYSGSH